MVKEYCRKARGSRCQPWDDGKNTLLVNDRFGNMKGVDSGRIRPGAGVMLLWQEVKNSV